MALLSGKLRECDEISRESCYLPANVTSDDDCEQLHFRANVSATLYVHPVSAGRKGNVRRGR